MKKLFLLSACFLSACSSSNTHFCKSYIHKDNEIKETLFIQQNGYVEKEEFMKDKITSYKGLYRLEGENLIIYMKDKKAEYLVQKDKEKLIEKHNKKEFDCY